MQTQQRVILNAPASGASSSSFQPPLQQYQLNQSGMAGSVPSSYVTPVGAQSSSFIPHTLTIRPPVAAAAAAAAGQSASHAFTSPSSGSIPLGS